MIVTRRGYTYAVLENALYQ